MGKGGGVATFVKDETSYSLINIGKEQEAVVVKVWTEKGSLTIINYYNPCNRLTIDVLNNVGGLAHGKMVWCGDFNAHSTLWGSKDTDANGLVVEEFINGNIVCINDGKGTRYNSMHNTESAIDLTLVSCETAGVSVWEVLNQSPLGSDHYPIVIKIGKEIHQDKGLRIPRWKLGKADWKAFEEKSEVGCAEQR